MKLPLNGSHKRSRGPHGVLPSISRLARPRDVLIAAAVSPIHPPHDLKTISPHVVLTVAWLSLALLVPPNSSSRRLSNHIGAAIPRRRRRPRDSSLAFPELTPNNYQTICTIFTPLGTQNLVHLQPRAIIRQIARQCTWEFRLPTSRDEKKRRYPEMNQSSDARARRGSV